MRPGSFVHQAPTSTSGDDRAERTAVLRIPWWAWPAVLALDAPIVGAAWLGAVAWHVGTPAGAGPAIVVALSIWLVYMADRLLDARRLIATPPDRRAASVASLRHAFAIRHARPLATSWVLILALDVGLAASIFPITTLAYGLGVTAVAALALGARLRSTLAGVVVRAGLVGIAFAAAVAISLDPAAVGHGAPILVAFAGVCAANVTSIARWERGEPDGVDAPEVPSATALWMAVAALAGSLQLAALAVDPHLALCAAASAGLLLALHGAARHLPTEGVRLCADAALILPLASLVL